MGFCLLYQGLQGMRCCIETQGGVKKDNNIELRVPESRIPNPESRVGAAAASLLGIQTSSPHPLASRTFLSLRHLASMELRATGGSRLLAIIAFVRVNVTSQESNCSRRSGITCFYIDFLNPSFPRSGISSSHANCRRPVERLRFRSFYRHFSTDFRYLHRGYR